MEMIIMKVVKNKAGKWGIKNEILAWIP